MPTCHVIPGDINRPAQLGSDLEALGLDIHDLLHVRSFLDHNRPYSTPANYVRGTRKGKSTGAFAHLGEEIPADELEENLVRYLRRWAPYVGRFGLLVLELHTLPPEVAAANLVEDAGGRLRWDARIFGSIFGGVADIFEMCAGSWIAG